MNTLEQSQERMHAPIEGAKGYTIEEIKSNPSLHNKVMYDRFGIIKKWNSKRNILQYSDELCTTNRGNWRTRRFDWQDCDMEGYDLPYIRLYLLEEFKKIAPNYVLLRLNDK